MYKEFSSFIKRNPLAKLLLIIFYIYSATAEASSNEKMLLKEEETLALTNISSQKKERDSKMTHFMHENETAKPSILDTLPKNLTPLKYSQKVIETVVDNGFKWENIHQVIRKVKEELKEAEECITNNKQENLEEELGDLLLAATTLCTYLQTDPEESLKRATEKFEKRFRKVEEEFNNKKMNMKNATIEEILRAWQRAKS